MVKKAIKKVVQRSRCEGKTNELANAIQGSGDGAKYIVVQRSKLKNAPYNPRTIDAVTRKRLRENVERTGGLVQAPLWNIRTGNLVAGHRRVEVSDLIEKSSDYSLTVAVVDWNIEKEIEQNIALNNPSLAGQYDLEGLDELLSRPNVDLAHTGFDVSTLELMHYDQGLDIPDFLLTPEEIQARDAHDELVDDVEDAIEESDEIEEDEEAERLEEERIAKLKKRKKDFADRQKFFRQNRTQARISFPSDGTRALFMQTIGADPDAEMVDGMELLKALGVETEALELVEKEMPEKMATKRKKATSKRSV